MKDKSRIINELVSSASDIMEAHADYLELVAEGFDESNQPERAAKWREDIPKIHQAVELMRRLEGCWA